MTNEEIQEIAQTAHAQASAGQQVLMALMMTLRGNVLTDEILNSAFDIAAEANVAGSYNLDNKPLAAHATRTLQAIENMRQTIIRKN